MPANTPPAGDSSDWSTHKRTACYRKGHSGYARKGWPPFVAGNAGKSLQLSMTFIRINYTVCLIGFAISQYAILSTIITIGSYKCLVNI